MVVARRQRPFRGRERPIGDPTRPPIRTSHTREAWSLESRRLALIHNLTGRENEGMNQDARDVHALPAHRTVRRYIQRYRDYGHIRAYYRNGGRQRKVFSGIELVHLALYRCVYPTATAAEIIAYLWNVHGRFLPQPRFFHPSQISRAEEEIGLSRKRSATTARQAFSPANILRRQGYWTMNYPFGINDIRAEDQIDVDEAVVNITDAKRRYGKAHVRSRCRQVGPYTREGSTHLILAISGCPIGGRRWVHIRPGHSGTTIFDFYYFIHDVIQDLGPGTPQRRYCFILDNLIVHKNPLVLWLILISGHRFVFRAPYWPVDAPIEYVFNVVENALTIRMHEIYDDADLVQAIEETLRTIRSFENWFHHVGYR